MASRMRTGLSLSLQHCRVRRRHGRRQRMATSARPRRPEVVFSGIQPTGVPHLGNYLGALSNWIHIQDSAQPLDRLFYCVVGLHAVALPQDPRRLRQERRSMMTTLLALGLDPRRSCLFHQDEVPAHAELAWLLNCLAPVGRLQRMTTWKARLEDTTSGTPPSIAPSDSPLLRLGLLAYPVLQAADILLYKTTHVPVGDDQLQHLELTRSLASLWNKRFKSDILRIPQTRLTPQPRILNLRDPSLKMSKSNPNPATRILLTDEPDVISKKLAAAVTDSVPDLAYDPTSRPGVSNLLRIYAGMTNMPIDRVTMAFKGKMASHLKRDLTDLLVDRLAPFRREFARLRSEAGYVEQVERQGAIKATEVASQTLQAVKQAMGFL